mgnify:CR=1 FL=1
MKVHAERLDDAIALGRTMLEPSRSEPGCLAYDFYQHHADPNTICFVETWTSREALNAHFETPHFRDFVPQVEAFAVGPLDIRVFAVSGVEQL